MRTECKYTLSLYGAALMRHLNIAITAIFIYSLCLPLTVRASAVERAEKWLNQYAERGDVFSLSLTKNKIKFEGCKQKQYQLALSHKVTNELNIDAVVYYNKGLLDFGVLTQRVRSHEFEVVGWWNKKGYRIGLSHKVRPRHTMTLPLSDTVYLPTSTTAGVYIELPLANNNHLLTLGAMQESWDGNSASINLPWRSSKDNQITLTYAITY